MSNHTDLMQRAIEVCRSGIAAGQSHVRIFPSVMRNHCRQLFDEWRNGPNPEPY